MQYFTEVMDAWGEYKQLYIKKSTYSTYYNKINKHIKYYFHNVLLDSLTDKIILDFIKYLKDGQQLSNNYINDIIKILNNIIVFAHEKEIIKLNKIKPLKCNKKEIEVFSKEQQNILVQYLKKENTLYGLGVLIALFTGIRLGELCALKWDDIDLNTNILSVKRTIQRIKNFDKDIPFKTKLLIDTPKSLCSIRKIPLLDSLSNIIAQYKTNGNNYILTNTLMPCEPRNYERKYKEILINAKVEYKNFHVCRHTFATNCIREGMNYKVLSQILGHASVKTTLDLYVHTSESELHENILLLNDILKS